MGRIRSRSFYSKYQARWKSTRSLVCVGLDSDVTQLPECVLQEANPIWEFNRRIIDSTYQDACAYKPNLAFYLSDGTRGLEALERTAEYIPEEIPVILDCKAGDIGSTMEQYAVSFFDRMGFDAITLNPLMGSDVLKPVLKREGAFCFALALTSNPSAEDFLRKSRLCEVIPKWLSPYPVESVGAVVGATQTRDLRRMRELMPGRIFLIPGIGAQGGDLDGVLKNAVDSEDQPNILINSSRGIIFRERTPQFAQAAAQAASELKNRIIV
ncbi:MAG: orotidine-5'-phosphate decarboxylase [Candidatus Syntrophosphaera sp.]